MFSNARNGEALTPSPLLTETGPHTGIFEGTAQTGELPAGALASDTSIDHSPLMAIDKKKTLRMLFIANPPKAVDRQTNPTYSK